MQNRILSCPIPTNINPLSPNGFMFSIQRLPELTYFAQDVSLPAITLGSLSIATPFVNYPVAGDMVEFGDLTIPFLVDSNMSNYKAVFNWIRGLGFPENNTQYTEQVTSQLATSEVQASTSDATLSVLGSNNQVIQTIQFIDCIPTSLDTLTFTSTVQDVQYLVANVTFRYSYYRFI